MFHLLNPIWLFSLAALAIPVLIHLWNVRPGKTLKVGSIALLGETTSKRARSFRLTDLALLALRCLLLILMALLLSEPLWRSRFANNKITGWVLIEKEQFEEAYAKFKPEIDSVIRAGYEFHYFDQDFPKVAIEEALKGTWAKAAGSARPTYWTLLNSLNQQLPQDLPVLLITDDQLNRFSSNRRPSISYRLNWKTFSPADSVSEKIIDAFLTSRDSLKITIETSRPSGTSNRSEIIHPKDAGNSFQTDITDGKPVVRFKNRKDTSAVSIDTSTLNIIIYTDKYQADAAYVKAAISAIQTFTQRKIALTMPRKNTFPVKPDWVFWLSDKPVRVSADAKIFKYHSGKAVPLNSWIEFGKNDLAEKTGLFKRIGYKEPGGTVIWEDGFGNPLLTKEANAYTFYSHFDPDWSNLVWSEDFPKLLLSLLFNSHTDNIAATDRRSLDMAQQMPRTADTETVSPVHSNKETHLQQVFWLALFVIFAIERWLSHKQKTEPKYG